MQLGEQERDEKRPTQNLGGTTIKWTHLSSLEPVYISTMLSKRADAPEPKLRFEEKRQAEGMEVNLI